MTKMTANQKKQKADAAKKPGRDDPEQSRLFLKKARELGADEDQSEADELIERLAKRKPEPHSKRGPGHS